MAFFQTSEAEIPAGNVSANVVLEKILQFLCDILIDQVIDFLLFHYCFCHGQLLLLACQFFNSYCGFE